MRNPSWHQGVNPCSSREVTMLSSREVTSTNLKEITHCAIKGGNFQSHLKKISRQEMTDKMAEEWWQISICVLIIHHPFVLYVCGADRFTPTSEWTMNRWKWFVEFDEIWLKYDVIVKHFQVLMTFLFVTPMWYSCWHCDGVVTDGDRHTMCVYCVFNTVVLKCVVS